MVSVFPDPVLELHTTRSWDFLESDLGMKPYSYGTPKLHQHSSSDIIIGVIDTGNYLFLSLISDRKVDNSSTLIPLSLAQ